MAAWWDEIPKGTTCVPEVRLVFGQVMRAPFVVVSPKWCQVGLTVGREVAPKGTRCVPAVCLVFGQVTRAPLAIVERRSCRDGEFPYGSGKGPPEYLREARENLRIAIRLILKLVMDYVVSREIIVYVERLTVVNKCPSH